jgi:hypothetical protein
MIKSIIFCTNVILRKLVVISTILIMSLFDSCHKGTDNQDDPGTDLRGDIVLPDTGQTLSYTNTPGEDADIDINPPSYTDNGNGTVTDNVTGMMWQKADGGEMKYADAAGYCAGLVLGGYDDWRLPLTSELFAINSFDKVNPALSTTFFTKTSAEYWWANETRADNSLIAWAVNAGGGAGAHPVSETVSAGGTKKFHTRAIRNVLPKNLPAIHFTDNGDGTITDNYTGLIWQKIQPSVTMTWEEALVYAEGLSLAGKTDWRLPNVKELQSLNDVSLKMPSISKVYFPNISSGNYWSSTTLMNAPSKAWDINIDYGIISYNEKTSKGNVLFVR